MFHKTAIPLALLLVTQGLLAQQPPTSGGLLPSAPPQAPPRVLPEMRIEPRAAPSAPLAGEARVVVMRLRITGASLYSEADLLSVTGFVPGSEATLSQLQAMAARITSRYRADGYFVAQAYLPAQDIQDQSVTIAVNEGRYGAIELRNNAGLSEGTLRGKLDGLGGGDAIEVTALEERLLLLSDLPGVVVKSTLSPGRQPGTSDLLVDVTPGRRVTGSIDGDNAGNRYTGAYRAGATVNVNEPFGLGDVATLRVLTSGSGLRYARLSYQMQAGRAQVGVAYSTLDYELGKEFRPLGAHGTAGVASAFARVPLLRSRHTNVFAQLSLDAKQFRDVIDTVPSRVDRRTHVLAASVYGDHSDSLGGGGVTSYSVTVAAGDVDIRTPGARALDASTARSNGGFGKVAFSLMRLQSLGGPFSIYGSLSGQAAGKNLDPSEKKELGGMNAVRAYPEGEAFADQGLLGTVELRKDL
ncbi:ShlB/FhaC/HecB family hemolysin secretion/activation protein, partial [Ramlibacter sp.]|uniref:ShlB/FhaC/HecB family hemolysin secretion/activation protein n=1 Tax=Ramlibacter sp. TaxID=1917967 RepID=UPI003D1428A5